MNSSEVLDKELIAALSQLRQIRPEWRLGQTIANLAMTAGRLDAGGIWDLEDEEALTAARTLIQQYLRDDSQAVVPPVSPVHPQGSAAFQSS
jgi:hypothetical protein